MRRVHNGASGRLLVCTGVLLSCMQLSVTPAVAGTASLTILPTTGLDSYAISVVSPATCTDPRATNLQLRISGAGFPDNTNVTPNLEATVYPINPATGGYDVPLQDTLASFAAQQTPPAHLTGAYRFTLVCRPALGEEIYGSWSGTLHFTSPLHYRAVSTTTATTAVPPAVAEPSGTPVTTPPSPSPSPEVTHRSPSVSPHAVDPVPRNVVPTAVPRPAVRPAAGPTSVSSTTPTTGVIASASVSPGAAAKPRIEEDASPTPRAATTSPEVRSSVASSTASAALPSADRPTGSYAIARWAVGTTVVVLLLVAAWLRRRSSAIR